MPKPRPPRLQAELDRMEREYAELERDAQSVTRRELLRASLECLGWCAVGVFIMAFAWHVNDVLIGKAFLYGGMAVGYSGITYALVGAYRRGEERGDW
jgi:hypothetical protein